VLARPRQPFRHGSKPAANLVTQGKFMEDLQLTVSDLSQLIADREEIRAELRLLALEAFERWQELEARVNELEERLCRVPDREALSGAHRIAAVAVSPSVRAIHSRSRAE
jgi:BMFP domain-containing protein YqiC